MKILRVAGKVLLEFWREPQLLGLVLGLPVFFVLITAIGYGTAPRLATYPVVVYDQDGLAAAIVRRLEAARYPDGRAVFQVEQVERIEGLDERLKTQDAVVGLIARRGEGGAAEVVIRGDGTSMAFTRAGVQLERVLKEEAGGALRLVESSLPLKSASSDFELYAPGMIVFAILLLIPQTAMLVGREIREGTLARLQLSRLSGVEWTGGLALSQMLIAVFQVLLTFGAAALFGFRASGGSLGLAVGIGLLLSLSAVATGLVVGRFSRSDSDALNVGSVFTMLQVFLSGSFFAMPGPTIFTLGGVPLSFYDLLPATHATLVLQQVLVGGADLAFVAARLAVMAGLTVGLTGVCWVVFRGKHA